MTNMQLTIIITIGLLFISSCGQTDINNDISDKEEIVSTKAVKRVDEDSLRNPYSEYYLNDLDLRMIAQLIIQDSVQPIDNKVTFSILDSVTSGNFETRSYFSKAFDIIILKSDGALSEVIGSYCIKSINNNPNELLGWLFSGKFESSSESIASYIAYELVMGEKPEKEKEELFKKINADALNKSTYAFSKTFIVHINKAFELLIEE